LHGRKVESRSQKSGLRAGYRLKMGRGDADQGVSIYLAAFGKIYSVPDNRR
jgi:hypothetical protein